MKGIRAAPGDQGAIDLVVATAAFGLGIDYAHIPVVFDAPTDNDLAQFFAAMEANQHKKCFVHCIANARVSAFVMLYRVLRQGVPVAEADATMRHIWEPNPTWQAFIEKHLAQGASHG